MWLDVVYVVYNHYGEKIINGVSHVPIGRYAFLPSGEADIIRNAPVADM